MLERGLSIHSISAYEDDVQKLHEWSHLDERAILPSQIKYEDLTSFPQCYSKGRD